MKRLNSDGEFAATKSPKQTGKIMDNASQFDGSIVTNDYQNYPPINLAILEKLLRFVEADTCRDEWVKNLMSIKSEFGENGKEIAREWSATAPSYSSKSFMSTWRSISAHGSVTIGSLIRLAQLNGWQPEQLNNTELKNLQAEREKRRADNAKREKAEAKQTKERQQTVSEKTYQILANALPADDSHPYLIKKKVSAHGILFGRVDKYPPSLLVPVIGTQEPFKGMYQNVQRIYDKPIYDNKDKFFIKHGRKAGGFYPIQWIKNADIVICEGFATGATLTENYCQSSSVICAFDSGNIVSVAKAFRRNHPTAKIIIAGDNDRFDKQGNPSKTNAGIKAAEEAAKLINGFVSVPMFSDAEAGSDWNDRYLLDFDM